MPDPQQGFQCSQCGAVNRSGTKRCWLCGADLDTPVVYAELAPDVPPVGAWQFTLSELMIVVTLIAVIAGTWAIEPATGVMLVIVSAPALLVTFIRTARRRSRGQDVTWASKIVTFLITAAAVVGIVMLLWAAAIVALIVYCFFNPIRF
jgi:hypothetical protein